MQSDAVLANFGKTKLGNDAARRVDLELVANLGVRRGELESAQALVETGFLLVADCFQHGELGALVIDELCLDVGGFSGRRTCLKVNAAWHAPDQVAALGVEIDEQLVQDDRDGSDQR